MRSENSAEIRENRAEIYAICLDHHLIKNSLLNSLLSLEKLSSKELYSILITKK